MIGEKLEKVGLTRGEIEVYEALLDLGMCTTGKITKKANIASSKVYEVLGRLIEKGLASSVNKNGVNFFDATPPERLIDFLEEKKENIISSQEEIRKIIPLIKQKREATSIENQTTVYSGSQGPKIIIREIIESAIEGNEVLGFGTDEDDYAKYYPKELKKYVESAKKNKIKERLIFGKGFRSLNKNAKIRYLPKEFAIPVRTMIYENKVAIVNFSKPTTTILIENSEIANSYRKHFNYLWSIAKN